MITHQTGNLSNRTSLRWLGSMLLISPLVVLLTLTACQQPTSGASIADRLALDAEALSASNFALAPGDTPSDVTTSFTLPTKGDNGSAISWKSSNPSLLSISGSTAQVESTYSETGEGVVTLTATLSLDGLTKQVTLQVTVRLWDYTGSATFYTTYSGSGGSCGYTAAEVPSSNYVVAAPDFLNNAGALCGAWIQLSSLHSSSPGSKAAVIDVLVADDNPSASGPDYAFDLTSEAFTALGETVYGSLAGLDWRFIEGPDTTIKVRNASGMNAYYLRFVVSGNKYGLAKVEIRDSGSYSSWAEIPRTVGGTFSLSSPGSSAFTAPVYFRFTDVHGDVVEGGEVTDITTTGTTFDTGVQFPSGKGGGTLADFGF